MADRLYRAQVSIPLDSGVPEDAIVNTWHFDDDDDPVAAPSDTMDFIMSMLTDFYQAIDGVVFPLSVGSPAVVRFYDMAEPTPRQVLDTRTISLVTSTGNALPGEVALCMSFKAAGASGVNPARRRGRIFLGPISEDAVAIIGSQSRPSLAARTAVAEAAGPLLDGLEHPGSPGFRCRWALYSPTTDAGGASLGDSFFDVLEGWLDDAWDTQRRRGAAPTARVIFEPTP